MFKFILSVLLILPSLGQARSTQDQCLGEELESFKIFPVKRINERQTRRGVRYDSVKDESSYIQVVREDRENWSLSFCQGDDDCVWLNSLAFRKTSVTEYLPRIISSTYGVFGTLTFAPGLVPGPHSPVSLTVGGSLLTASAILNNLALKLEHLRKIKKLAANNPCSQDVLIKLSSDELKKLAGAINANQVTFSWLDAFRADFNDDFSNIIDNRFAAIKDTEIDSELYNSYERQANQAE